MSLESSIKEKIIKLEKDEYDSVYNVTNEIRKKNISAIHDRKIFARTCLLIDKNNSKNLFSSGEDATWTNAIDNVLLFKQLLHKNHLIVDLKPNLISNNEFVKAYGFTVQQMSKLVRDKVVVLNLYAYESNKTKEFKDYTFFEGNPEEKHAYESLFIQDNNMRINSIRRQILFDQLTSERNTSYNELLLESKDTLKRIIHSQEVVNTLKSKGIIRATTVDGAIQQLVQQYAEVKTLLMVEEDKYGHELLEGIETEDSNYLKNVATIRALRIALTSPFSAALGGDYSMSSSTRSSIDLGNYYLTGNLLDAVNPITFRDNKHPLSIIINQFLENTTLKKFRLNNSPLYINDNYFNDYIEFIKENKVLINLQNRLIKQFIEDKGDFYTDDKLTILENYLNSQKDLNKSVEDLTSDWILIFKIGINVVLTLLAPDYQSQKSIGALSYGGASEAIKEKLSPYLAKLLLRNEYQVFLDGEEIKKFLLK